MGRPFLILVLLGLAALVYALTGSDLFSGMSGVEISLVLIGGGITLAYVAALLLDYQGNALQGLRYGAIWVAIFAAFATLYTFRDDLSTAAMRVASETLPPGYVVTVEERVEGQTAVRIRRQQNGHFSARSKVNGANIRMLVDTGASTIVLKPADAQKAGIDVNSLNFSVPVDTANGTAFAAPIRLRSVKIGPIELTNIDALVTRPGALNQSLLGMSFLRRLRSYEFSGEFLTLKG
jgi:aspartyl protease family protein